MAPSQLKQLKASLRENGLVGPQQSKKQKKKAARDGRDRERHTKRNAALDIIREKFNPFEVKAASRPKKFETTSIQNLNSSKSRVLARPSVTKSLGEEKRRQTLLKELQRRSKVGGIVDRRFGENDPSMTPDERAAERFARESRQRAKKRSLFNLEDEEEEERPGLTHLGRSLTFDEDSLVDDEKRDDFEGVDDEVSSDDEHRTRKRRRLSPLEHNDQRDGIAEVGLERQKTKNEVMKEIIAKSKLYKYERQKVKEDDDDLLEELDSGLAEIYQLVGDRKPNPPPTTTAQGESSIQMNPDRAALLNGKGRAEADREYDERLKQMTFDKRSKPSDRTKTEEEKAAEEAERLKKLEADRIRRMQGDLDSGSESGERPDALDVDDQINDDAKEFGLTLINGTSMRELGVEDEDDFVIDDNLVANDSDVDVSESNADSPVDERLDEDEDDAEFIGGLSLPPDAAVNNSSIEHTQIDVDDAVGYTFSCPRTHDEFLDIARGVPIDSLPTVIQRIRALYHPKLDGNNKSRMEEFSVVLTEHVACLANSPTRPPFNVLENLIRHLHSLAKTFPDGIARAFRSCLKAIDEERPLSLAPGDLVLLTGIGSIFPTSDHFHQVVTPAVLTIARYLGQSTVHSLGDLVTGAYLCCLGLQYQTISHRYMPEIMNYILIALEVLAPIPPKRPFGHAPHRQPSQSLQVKRASKSTRQLNFWDVIPIDRTDDREAEEALKSALIENFVQLLETASDLWRAKSAFEDIFAPAKRAFAHLLGPDCRNKLSKPTQTLLQSTLSKIDHLLSLATLRRRPLLLHNHRPLAIKTAIPKFEDSFNPDRHYDPDRERAAHNKLRAEHKRERKGAIRELRKDANFVAREKLKEKKAKDVEYERKYRRLVAEINAEEGKEANEYERERVRNKRKRKT